MPRLPKGVFNKSFREAIAPFRNRARLDEFYKEDMKVKVGDKFKRPEMKKPFVIIRVIPNGMVVGSFNPEGKENLVEEYLLIEELENFERIK